MASKEAENLAAVILAEHEVVNAVQEKKTRNRPAIPYYMMDIRHPAIEALYKEWAEKAGVRRFPPSDKDRTLFELSCMSDAALEMLKDHYKEALKYGKGFCRISSEEAEPSTTTS